MLNHFQTTFEQVVLMLCFLGTVWNVDLMLFNHITVDIICIAPLSVYYTNNGLIHDLLEMFGTDLILLQWFESFVLTFINIMVYIAYYGLYIGIQ